ncbi:Large conductance mechano-sensitive channel protein [Elusimicrobium minutum Pei191]|uniref:Large-conductance mechanosensitive channel n=1 Tax=Elusimicrobium minutum (strain Pei191) TaxID=445932 RepID=B2KAX8_ELUMP|nr:large conductance mechanosensitive channel protein MscL [Elusimicrobium minutum]ACC97674.1 Large conductance mechano-sensitive channel protein [Elusimicrobium minutum Pei191]
MLKKSLVGVVREFKTFAMRGNVMDMAVGVILGAAFGKIVDSLVKDVLMPFLGLLLGKIDFSNLYLVIKQGSVHGPYATLQAAQSAGASTINYGMFLNNIISFIIVAFAIFIMIKFMNNLKRKEEPAPVTTKSCPFCFSDINIQAIKCPDCTADLNK